MKRSLHILSLALLLAVGCSTGKKALEKGDYIKAVEQAVNRLQKDTDNDDAMATLPLAYQLAIKNLKGNIERARTSTNVYRWETIVNNYQTINYLYDQVQACSACINLIKSPELVTTELGSAREAAAQVRYDMAITALNQKENRKKAIQAIEHLKRATSYVSNYRDSEQLMDEAYFYATLKVVVEPVQVPRNLQYSQDFFNNKMAEYLHRNNINTYVRFYTPEEAKAEDLPWIDHYVVMNFDGFTLGDIIMETEIVPMTRDSVVLRKDRRGEPVYGSVTAKFKYHHKKVIGSGVLDFQIIDENLNKVISQEKFASAYEWNSEWGSYNGDDRALNTEQKRLAELREPPIPSPQFMFENFANPIFDRVTAKLTSYYRNY